MDQKKCEVAEWKRARRNPAFASRTPRKIGEPLRSQTEVADEYETIVELFDRMTCSLRLLDLREKSPTFWNVSAQVEVLAKRKFRYSHLAQIKYLLPEVIQIEKLLIYDKKTLCMRSNMKITVQLDAIEMCREQSGFVALRELFKLRLVDYFTDHLEVDVDCVLVVFGGVTGYSSDDINNRFLWMVRVGGGVFPVIKEPDYLVNGEYRVDKDAAPKMLNCLMYKLSYYRFGEVTTEYGKPPGYDHARGVEIGNKDIKLEYLEEAFTTSNWIVRIYKVKPPNNMW